MNRGHPAALDPIFHPRGVAVIGASANPAKFGHYFVKCLAKHGYSPVYPVHPTATEVLGRRAYGRVTDIPDPVDLAVIVTPVATVPGAVQECARKGVKGVVIYTSGYGELGEEGRRQEQELTRLAQANGVRIIGPNCLGIYCPGSKLANSDYLPEESGPIGMVSHSGSLCTLLVEAAGMRGLHFSKVISTGNECDLAAVDFLEYLGQDDETRIIVCYLEGMRQGPKFVRLAKEIAGRKPILLWKGGVTGDGAKAAASHTGALCGSSEIWEAVIRQTGMVAVHSMEELVDCLQSFYYLEPVTGGRVAIVSAPGGPAVTTSDACAENGLSLAELADETRRAIAAVIPPTGTSPANPVDLGQSARFAPRLYAEAMKYLAADPGVDVILTIGRGEGRLAETVAGAKEVSPKPVVFVAIDQLDPAGPAGRALYSARVPVFTDSRRAVRALGATVRHSERVRRRAMI
jgi:acetyltransferase